jgi:cellulose synthase operon protein C
MLPAQTLQEPRPYGRRAATRTPTRYFANWWRVSPAIPVRVRWGRMFLEHWQADEADRLFGEALELKANDAEAMLGKALVSAESVRANAADFAQKALRIDPKLVEAQELLARLALEDDNRRKPTSKPKRRWPRTEFGAGQSRSSHAGLAGGQERKPWDPHAAKGYETAGHFFMLNRRYEESVAFYRKAIDLDPAPGRPARSWAST